MMRGENKRPRRTVVLITVFVASLFAFVTGFVLLLINTYGLESVSAEWAAIRPYVLVAKWSAMILLIVRWRSVVAWAGQRFQLDPETVARLEAMRWRAATALAVIEVFIGQNLFWRLAATA